MTDRPGAPCWHCESTEHDTAAHQHEPPVPPAEPVEREGDAERDAQWRRALKMDEPWGAFDVLAKLADAADHLLKWHSCDTHGWEEFGRARDQARRIVAEWPELLRSRPAAKGKATGCPTCARGVPCIDHLDTRHPGAIAKNASALPAGAVDEREALREAEALLNDYIHQGLPYPPRPGWCDRLTEWKKKFDALKGTP